MAITKLSCPDCGTVLRPGKPVEPGKKVKCPRCEIIFVAEREADDDDDRPRKAAKKPAAKKAAPAAKEKEKKKEEEVYGYVKDADEEKPGRKPRIEYAPDDTIKDLRGPAIMKLRKPATFLQFIGMAGALGWMALFVMLIIPTAFPVEPDAAEKEKLKQEAERPPEKGKEKAPPPAKFFEVQGFDMGETKTFLILMGPMILAFVYACLVTGGGIKMANLESRRFSIAASIMVMLPIHAAGLTTFLSLIFQWLAGTILDDRSYGLLIGSGIGAILYLLCLVTGGWCLRTLMDEEVIEGFEYEPE